jgi:hypothetical protein
VIAGREQVIQGGEHAARQVGIQRIGTHDAR